MSADDLIDRCAARGLNLVAVFDLDALTSGLRERIAAACPEMGRFRQLILLGNAGTSLWRKVGAANAGGAHPVDDYTMRAVEELFRERCRYLLLYPGDHAAPLQQLGSVAGWHHDSPLGIGIHPEYGLWFAYRAAVVADSDFPVTAPLTRPSPCLACIEKPCIAACPPRAVRASGFDVPGCSRFRLAAESPCARTCLARLACPVAGEHRYDADQLAYHYAYSLASMRRHAGG